MAASGVSVMGPRFATFRPSVPSRPSHAC